MGRYEYETSPRKLEPDYVPPKKKKKNQNIKNVQEKEKLKKIETKKHAKLIIYIGIGFLTLFTISYRNTVINENFAELKNLKTDLAVIEKENEQLKVNIENSLNYNNIEKMAKEKLGMQKVNNNQTVYVNLPRQDYIEPATEEVIIDSNKSLMEKVYKFLKEGVTR